MLSFVLATVAVAQTAEPSLLCNQKIENCEAKSASPLRAFGKLHNAGVDWILEDIGLDASTEERMEACVVLAGIYGIKPVNDNDRGQGQGRGNDLGSWFEDAHNASADPDFLEKLDYSPALRDHLDSLLDIEDTVDLRCGIDAKDLDVMFNHIADIDSKAMVTLSEEELGIALLASSVFAGSAEFWASSVDEPSSYASEIGDVANQLDWIKIVLADVKGAMFGARVGAVAGSGGIILGGPSGVVVTESAAIATGATAGGIISSIYEIYEQIDEIGDKEEDDGDDGDRGDDEPPTEPGPPIDPCP